MAICYLIMLRLAVLNKLKHNQKRVKSKPLSATTLSDLLADTRGDRRSEKTSAKIVIDPWHTYLKKSAISWNGQLKFRLPAALLLDRSASESIISDLKQLNSASKSTLHKKQQCFQLWPKFWTTIFAENLSYFYFSITRLNDLKSNQWSKAKYCSFNPGYNPKLFKFLWLKPWFRQISYKTSRLLRRQRLKLYSNFNVKWVLILLFYYCTKCLIGTHLLKTLGDSLDTYQY